MALPSSLWESVCVKPFSKNFWKPQEYGAWHFSWTGKPWVAKSSGAVACLLFVQAVDRSMAHQTRPYRASTHEPNVLVQVANVCRRPRAHLIKKPLVLLDDLLLCPRI